MTQLRCCKQKMETATTTMAKEASYRVASCELSVFVGVPTQYIIPWRCKAIDVVFCYHREYLDVAFALRWGSMFRLQLEYRAYIPNVYPWLQQSAQCKKHNIVVVAFYVFSYLLHTFNNGEMKIINLKQTRCRIQFAGYMLHIKLHMRCTQYRCSRCQCIQLSACWSS